MALSGAYPLGLTLERSRLGIAMIAGLVLNPIAQDIWGSDYEDQAGVSVSFNYDGGILVVNTPGTPRSESTRTT